MPVSGTGTVCADGHQRPQPQVEDGARAAEPDAENEGDPHQADREAEVRGEAGGDAGDHPPGRRADQRRPLRRHDRDDRRRRPGRARGGHRRVPPVGALLARRRHGSIMTPRRPRSCTSGRQDQGRPWRIQGCRSGCAQGCPRYPWAVVRRQVGAMAAQPPPPPPPIDEAPPPGGPGVAQFFDRIRRYGAVRPDEGRWFAGVASGLGPTLGHRPAADPRGLRHPGDLRRRRAPALRPRLALPPASRRAHPRPGGAPRRRDGGLHRRRALRASLTSAPAGGREAAGTGRIPSAAASCWSRSSCSGSGGSPVAGTTAGPVVPAVPVVRRSGAGGWQGGGWHGRRLAGRRLAGWRLGCSRWERHLRRSEHGRLVTLEPEPASRARRARRSRARVRRRRGGPALRHSAPAALGVRPRLDGLGVVDGHGRSLRRGRPGGRAGPARAGAGAPPPWTPRPDPRRPSHALTSAVLGPPSSPRPSSSPSTRHRRGPLRWWRSPPASRWRSSGWGSSPRGCPVAGPAAWPRSASSRGRHAGGGLGRCGQLGGPADRTPPRARA